MVVEEVAEKGAVASGADKRDGAVRDGKIKFRQELRKGDPPNFDELRSCDYWRNVFYRNGIVGQYSPDRGGAGYGNVSQRLSHGQSRGGRDWRSIDNRFVITGSNTGHLPRLGREHYTTVTECFPEENRAVVHGPIEASSESMTHYAVYSLGESVNFVFHTHSPEIWNNSRRLLIPTTRADAEYGTPEMVVEVERLWNDTNVRDIGILSMGGHEEGVMTWGRTAAEAGMRMMVYYQIGRAISLGQRIIEGKPGEEIGGRVLDMFVGTTIDGYRRIKRRIAS